MISIQEPTARTKALTKIERLEISSQRGENAEKMMEKWEGDGPCANFFQVSIFMFLFPILGIYMIFHFSNLAHGQLEEHVFLGSNFRRAN